MDLKYEDFNAIGTVLAFSDGKHLFVSDKVAITLRNGISDLKPEFYKVVNLGWFVHYIAYGYNRAGGSGMYGGGASASSSTRVLVDKFIDLKTNKLVNLSSIIKTGLFG